MRRLALASLLLAVVSALVTCGASAARHPIPTAGASLAVPGGWTTVDSRLVTDSAAFEELVDENPSLKPFLASISRPSSVIKLMSFNLPAVRGFVTNVNVVVTPAAPGVTLAQIAMVYKSQLRTLLPTLNGPVATRLVSLPAGRAVQATYRLTLSFYGRRTIVQQRQFILLRGGKNVVLTFSTLPDQLGRKSATFTSIARSLRFG